MKRWMKILCVLTVLVCVVWGAVSYFHYNTVRTLLNRAELADDTNSRELWYSRNLMGLGYTDNYEILLMRLSDAQNAAMAQQVQSDSRWTQEAYPFEIVGKKLTVREDAEHAKQFENICFSAWREIAREDEKLICAYSEEDGVMLVYRAFDFGVR